MYTIAIIVVLYFYIRLAIWLARKATEPCKKKRCRWGLRILIALVFILIPTGDSIVGRIYFNHLCATQAGAKVYHTIELPAKYWDKDGRPRFLNSRGGWDSKILGKRFEWKRKTVHVLSGLIRIDQKKWILHDNQSNKELGELDDFYRYFGWMNVLSTAPNVTEGCQNMWVGKYSQKSFMLRIFTNLNNGSGV